jgi:hypothetical protein
MEFVWFKKWGWIYRPISPFGWIISILAIALCLQVFIAVDMRVNSISDLFYGVLPYFVSYLVIAGWIASNTTKKS